MTLNVKFEHLSKVTAHLLRHSLCEIFARLIGPRGGGDHKPRQGFSAYDAITLTLDLLTLFNVTLHPLPKSSMWVTYESDKAKGKK